MKRILIILSVLLMTASAHAETVRVADRHDPQQRHRQIAAAAEKVCRTAVENDMFNEYGSLSDCVDATISSVSKRPITRTNLATN